MKVFNNKYRLEQQLGQGSFSEVWKATELQTNVVFALKIYKPLPAQDDDGMQMMRREFAIVSNAIHQNLITPRIFDICDQQPFLVLNYSERGNISRCRGKINEREAWQLLHDVAAGLNYLHTRMRPPIIHQDIKPANILMGDDGNYKITDFGVSIQAKTTLSLYSPDKDPLISAGTIPYMGPERFSADNRPLAKSDVWSLGAMMFEMITSRLPFGENGGAFQNKYAPEVPDVGEEYTLQLRNILRRCLQRDPQQRPTAAQIEALCNDMLSTLPKPDRMFPIDELPAERSTNIMSEDKLQDILNYTPITPSPQPSPDPDPAPEPPEPPEPQEPQDDKKGWLRKWSVVFGVIIVVLLLLAAIVMGVGWPKPTPAPPQPPTTDSVKTPNTPPIPKPVLPYGDWTGKIRDGQPHGKGTLTLTSPHSFKCNDGETIVVGKGDKIVDAVFYENSVLYKGTWIKQNGETIQILIKKQVPEPKKLDYGRWTGKISSDGQPYGKGTLTLTATHSFKCNNGETIVAGEGDKIVNADFVDGILYKGKWIRQNGETKQITP